jgi:5-(carboxyamino)imidazole ribonucleotide synthase
MSDGVRVGILGGGQLALMLADAGRELGLHVRVLSKDPSDPAAPAAEHVAGDPNAVADILRFSEGCDLVTFENEFVPAAALRALAELGGDRVRPAPSVLFELQNKGRQKRLLERLGIPSSRWLSPEAGERADDWARRMWLEFPEGPVLKWAELGYDGRGTCLAHSLEEAVEFAREAFARGREIFAEARVDFAREVAVVASRSAVSDFRAWPLVVSKQVGGTCFLVTGPATELGVPVELEEKAHDYARRIAEALDVTGTFAIELFETRDGRLLVNELAPRVHNSGHYTMDASATSQFANHWRGVLGLSLGDTRSHCGAFAMINLLGPPIVPQHSGELPVPTVSAMAGAEFRSHWYGKNEVRAGRKMGHVNAVVASKRDLAKAVERLEECERQWTLDIERGFSS